MPKIEWSPELHKLYDRFLGLKGMPVNDQSRQITIALCRDIEAEAIACGDKKFAKQMKNLRLNIMDGK